MSHLARRAGLLRAAVETLGLWTWIDVCTTHRHTRQQLNDAEPTAMTRAPDPILAGHALCPQTVRAMVLEYLAHQGYVDTAAAFAAHITHRHDARSTVSDGTSAGDRAAATQDGAAGSDTHDNTPSNDVKLRRSKRRRLDASSSPDGKATASVAVNKTQQSFGSLSAETKGKMMHDAAVALAAGHEHSAYRVCTCNLWNSHSARDQCPRCRSKVGSDEGTRTRKDKVVEQNTVLRSILPESMRSTNDRLLNQDGSLREFTFQDLVYVLLSTMDRRNPDADADSRMATRIMGNASEARDEMTEAIFSRGNDEPSSPTQDTSDWVTPAACTSSNQNFTPLSPDDIIPIDPISLANLELDESYPKFSRVRTALSQAPSTPVVSRKRKGGPIAEAVPWMESNKACDLALIVPTTDDKIPLMIRLVDNAQEAYRSAFAIKEICSMVNDDDSNVTDIVEYCMRFTHFSLVAKELKNRGKRSDTDGNESESASKSSSRGKKASGKTNETVKSSRKSSTSSIPGLIFNSTFKTQREKGSSPSKGSSDSLDDSRTQDPGADDKASVGGFVNAGRPIPIMDSSLKAILEPKSKDSSKKKNQKDTDSPLFLLASQLYFELLILDFVRRIRKNDMSALNIAREELQPFADTFPLFRERCVTFLGLLAYTDPQTSPLANLVSGDVETLVCEIADQYVLQEAGVPPYSALELISRQVFFIRSQKKKLVKKTSKKKSAHFKNDEGMGLDNATSNSSRGYLRVEFGDGAGDEDEDNDIRDESPHGWSRSPLNSRSVEQQAARLAAREREGFRRQRQTLRSLPLEMRLARVDDDSNTTDIYNLLSPEFGGAEDTDSDE